MINFVPLMMIRFSLSVFILFTLQLSLFAQDSTAVNWNQLDENGLKVGKWQANYQSGSRRYVGQFENGKPFGVFKYYFPSGELQTVLEYFDREGRQAFATLYYHTGEKMAEGWYLDQKKDSTWKTFGANETILSEGAYYQGEKYGLWKTYYPNGVLAEELYFQNDYEHGPMKTYFDNGKLKQEANFENGFLNGLSIQYDPQGKKIIKGIYYKGARDKNWVYYKDLEVDKVLEYDKGKLLNPEVLPETDGDSLMNSIRNNRKDYLEFEDLRGKIKYE
tara:strand:- start:8099 stop:8926 length:828 start_codon:yes stop_codon:yes gene_type:complete